MITVKELINKIKWDGRENPDDYVFYYMDRISKEKKEIKFSEIKRVEEGFIIIDGLENEEISIPLHRIKEIKKRDKIVWKR